MMLKGVLFMEFRLLPIGDVVAQSGMQLVCKRLRQLKKEHQVHLCIVNGENASNVGITPEQADRLFDAGADIITLGNHAFSPRSIVPMAEDCPYLLRPANYSPLTPGRGWGIFDTCAGPAAVMVLQGRVGMDYTPDNPFLAAERILKELDTKVIFVEMHAEATSEKLAMGYHLDGKISALWGTHTHVPTADLQILPGGTGYVTDLGMRGPIGGILGIKPELSIARFRGALPRRYEPAPGPCKMEGALFHIDTETGLCRNTERVFYRD